MSHLFVDIFFELSVVENVAFTINFTVILTLGTFDWMSQHERKISPVSK